MSGVVLFNENLIRGGRATKKFYSTSQNCAIKFLIGETQAQIAQEKIKSEKSERKLRKKKIKSIKRNHKLRNYFQKFNKAQAQIAQILKKNRKSAKRK